MPLVIRPVDTGASKLGTVKAIAADTPYQNLNLPDLSTSAVAGSKAISGALTKTAEAYTAIVKADDKNLSLDYEAELAALNEELLSNPETGLESMQGQARLDRINGTNGTGGSHPIEPSNGILNEYKTRSAALAEKYMPGMSQNGRDAQLISDSVSATTFRGVVNGAQNKAQFTVDTKRLENRMAGSVTTMVAATGTLAQGTAVKTEFAKIESTIRDPDVGWAKVNGTTDKAIIDDYVKAQQGTAIQAMITELVSQGKAIDANALFEEHSVSGGVLEGTAIGTELQGTLKTLSDVQHATDDFESLYAKHTTDGTTDWGKLYDDAYATDDAALQAGIIQQANGRRGIDSAEVTRKQAEADTAIIMHIAQGGSAGNLPGEAILAASPRVRAALLGGGLELKAAKTAEGMTELQHHIANGGTKKGDPNRAQYWAQMAIDDPNAFMKAMGEADAAAVRSGLSLGQFTGLQKTAAGLGTAAQKAIVEAAEGVKLPDLKASLVIMGYESTSSAYARLLANPTFVSSMNEFNVAFTKQNHRLPSSADLNAHAATMLIDVHVRDPNVGVSEDAEAAAGNVFGNKAGPLVGFPNTGGDRRDFFLDVSNDKPKSKLNDINRIARAYGMTPEGVRQTLAQLADDDVSDPTVGDFEDAIAPPATDAELEMERLELDSNLPVGLLEFVTGGDNPLILNGSPATASQAAETFADNPTHPTILRWLAEFEARGASQ